MKRDMDLVRTLLLLVEEQHQGGRSFVSYEKVPNVAGGWSLRLIGRLAEGLLRKKTEDHTGIILP